MSILIKKLRQSKFKKLKLYFDDHKKLREWLWFLCLWLAGIGAVAALTYPIRFLIRYAS